MGLKSVQGQITGPFLLAVVFAPIEVQGDVERIRGRLDLLRRTRMEG